VAEALADAAVVYGAKRYLIESMAARCRDAPKVVISAAVGRRSATNSCESTSGSASGCKREL
jgi:hypothetical protein